MDKEPDTLPIDPADVFATMSSEELVSILTRACDSIQPISDEVVAVLALLREAGKRITALQLVREAANRITALQAVRSEKAEALLAKADAVVALALTQRDAYKVDLQEMEAEVRHLTGKLDACEQHVVILQAERVRHAQEHHGEG